MKVHTCYMFRNKAEVKLCEATQMSTFGLSQFLFFLHIQKAFTFDIMCVNVCVYVCACVCVCTGESVSQLVCFGQTTMSAVSPRLLPC